MIKLGLVRATLWLSVPFNLIAAYSLLMPKSAFGQFIGLPTEVPLLYAILVSLFVAIFGAMYGYLAWQTAPNRALLAMGVIGKMSVFLAILLLWFGGAVAMGVPLLATGDFVFATIWWLWLRASDSS